MVNNLLLDRAYVEKVIQSVNDQLKNFFGNSFHENKGLTISFSSYRMKNNDKIEKQLI